MITVNITGDNFLDGLGMPSVYMTIKEKETFAQLWRDLLDVKPFIGHHFDKKATENLDNFIKEMNEKYNP